MSDTRQGDLGLKENGQHRKRNRAAAIAMEAGIEERLSSSKSSGRDPFMTGTIPRIRLEPGT